MVYGFVLGIYYSVLKEYSKEEFAEHWINRKKIDEIIRIEGIKDATSNLVCIDDVVAIMREIIKNTNEINKTYHLTNDKYLTVEEIISGFGEALRIKDRCQEKCV